MGMIIVILVGFMITANAEIPGQISYQGILTDDTGTPLDGDFLIRFNIYGSESGTDSLWSSGYQTVNVDEGLFIYRLGSIMPIPDDLFAGSAIRYLGITVSPDLEIVPRTRFLAVPYAYHALRADSTDWDGLTNVPAGFADGIDDVGEGSKWTVTDSVLYTNNYWGIARGGAGNVLDGDSVHTLVNLGVACTTGMDGYNIRYTTIGGGLQNTTIGFNSTISGGRENTTGGETATIGGGFSNSASGTGATVAGGIGDTASGFTATIGGGENNSAGGAAATIGGGYMNSTSRSYATISGGAENTVVGSDYATISGGFQNLASGYGATIGGGENNSVSGGAATIGGGIDNSASGFIATVGGGWANSASSDHATVPGGVQNTASGDFATVGGGSNNTASGLAATVGGGGSNSAASFFATVGGGSRNSASYIYATIGGGENNSASGEGAAVTGGIRDTASGFTAAIGGGEGNTASGDRATVGGGSNNTASGQYATVPGGTSNTAGGIYSFAAGRRAKADSAGSFVWADNTNADFASSAVNGFYVRASGGVYMYTSSDLSTGAYLSSGSGTWASISDRTVKRNIREVDYRNMLDKVVALPVSQWSYKTQDESIEHVGPMAQDFYRLFGLAEDDKHLTSLDLAGVSLAAAKGLYEMNQEQKARLDEQAEEISNLKDELLRLALLVEGKASIE
jgi:hypothetical protein